MKADFIVVQKDEDSNVFVYECSEEHLRSCFENRAYKGYTVVSQEDLIGECSLVDGDYGSRVLAVIENGEFLAEGQLKKKYNIFIEHLKKESNYGIRIHNKFTTVIDEDTGKTIVKLNGIGEQQSKAAMRFMEQLEKDGMITVDA